MYLLLFICCYYFQEDCDEASDDLVVTEHDENVMKHKCPTEFENLKIEDVRLLFNRQSIHK